MDKLSCSNSDIVTCTEPQEAAQELEVEDATHRDAIMREDCLGNSAAEEKELRPKSVSTENLKHDQVSEKENQLSTKVLMEETFQKYDSDEQTSSNEKQTSVTLVMDKLSCSNSDIVTYTEPQEAAQELEVEDATHRDAIMREDCLENSAAEEKELRPKSVSTKNLKHDQVSEKENLLSTTVLKEETFQEYDSNCEKKTSVTFIMDKLSCSNSEIVACTEPQEDAQELNVRVEDATYRNAIKGEDYFEDFTAKEEELEPKSVSTVKLKEEVVSDEEIIQEVTPRCSSVKASDNHSDSAMFDLNDSVDSKVFVEVFRGENDLDCVSSKGENGSNNASDKILTQEKEPEDEEIIGLKRVSRQPRTPTPKKRSKTSVKEKRNTVSIRKRRQAATKLNSSGYFESEESDLEGDIGTTAFRGSKRNIDNSNSLSSEDDYEPGDHEWTLDDECELSDDEALNETSRKKKKLSESDDYDDDEDEIRHPRKRKRNAEPEEEDFVWRELGNKIGKERNVGPFTGETKANLDKIDPSMFDVFEEVFPIELFEFLMKETNSCAEIFFKNRKVSKFSRFCSWVPTTLNEMRNFIGLLLLMGIRHMPKIDMYWSSDAYFSNPVFPAIMTRDRFLSVLAFWPFSEFDNDKKFISFRKLEEFTELLETTIAKKYYPTKHLSLDESLVLFKGKLHFKQYIKTKSARYGTKVFKVVDENAVTVRLSLYTGKMKMIRDFSKTESVVVSLMEPFLNKGHVVFTDSFYTSPKLYQYLQDQKTGAIGTIRNDRIGLPKRMQNIKIEKGQKHAFETDNLLYVGFADQRTVFMLSNNCRNVEEKASRKTKEKVVTLQLPKAVSQYNKYMGFVDKTDQMLQYYSITRKTIKWYRKLVLHLIQVRLLDALGIYCYVHKKKVDFLSFTTAVIKGLTATMDIPLTRFAQPRLHGRHFLERCMIKDRIVSRTCRVCTKRKIKKQSSFQCDTCPGNIALCVVPCFRDYHKMEIIQ